MLYPLSTPKTPIRPMIQPNERSSAIAVRGTFPYTFDSLAARPRISLTSFSSIPAPDSWHLALAFNSEHRESISKLVLPWSFSNV